MWYKQGFFKRNTQSTNQKKDALEYIKIKNFSSSRDCKSKP